MDMVLHHLMLLFALLLAAAPSPDARRPWKEGVAQARAGNSWGARLSFTKAIEASPESARLRYARAAAEAPEFGTRACKGSNDLTEPRCAPESTLIEDLTWLRDHASTDPEAKKLLMAVPTDVAFDRVMNEPLPRLAMGFPAPGRMKATDRLLERQGKWVSAADLTYPEVTLWFARGGRVRLRVRAPDWIRGGLEPPVFATGTWKASSDGAVGLRFKWEEGVPESEYFIPEATRVEFDDELQRLTLRKVSGEDDILLDYLNTIRP